MAKFKVTFKDYSTEIITADNWTIVDATSNRLHFHRGEFNPANLIVSYNLDFVISWRKE